MIKPTQPRTSPLLMLMLINAVVLVGCVDFPDAPADPEAGDMGAERTADAEAGADAGPVQSSDMDAELLDMLVDRDDERHDMFAGPERPPDGGSPHGRFDGHIPSPDPADAALGGRFDLGPHGRFDAEPVDAMPPLLDPCLAADRLAGWRCISPGEHVRGSPFPEVGREIDERRHRVQLTYAFYIQITEVTQAEWMQYAPSNPSYYGPEGEGGCLAEAVDGACPDRPVESVTWREAVAWVNTRSLDEGLTPCYGLQGGRGPFTFDHLAGGQIPVISYTPDDCDGYRLPTEAEWESAARGEEAGPLPAQDLPWPDDALGCEGPAGLARTAWYCGNADRPQQVGRLRPVGEGIFDALGNVAEWTQDTYALSYPQGRVLINPLGAIDGEERTVRGGSFAMPAEAARFAARDRLHVNIRRSDVGFRVVRTLTP